MAFALGCGKALWMGVLLAGCCASVNVMASLATPKQESSGSATRGDDALTSGRVVSRLPDIPQKGEFALTPRLLLQLALARNADALYSRMASDISGQLALAEQGLFEVVAYGGMRHEYRKRQRTAQEITSNFALAKESLLDERVNLLEMGVRRRMKEGGEVSLSYRLNGRNNNLIEAATTQKKDTEYDGALALTFKQPLMRGYGNAVVEADRKIAELEWAVSKQQYKQQMLRSSSEALSSYWQLYRAQQTLQLRQESLRKAEAARADIEARIAGGRMAPRTAIEARSAVSMRLAEKFRAEQGVSEAESKIKTLLNLTGGEYGQLHFATGVEPSQVSQVGPIDAQRRDEALRNWPSYRIAELKRQQGLVRLDYAGNQQKPQFDLMASCSSTYLSYDHNDSAERLFKRDYPDCYLGLNLEIPIDGNLRAKSQLQAQRMRLSQSDLEIEAVRTTLTNDLDLRARQLERAILEVDEYRKDVELRQQLLKQEQAQFQFGMSRLSQVIARENELNAGLEGLLDSQARLELARVALQVADGSLFGAYAVEWQGD